MARKTGSRGSKGAKGDEETKEPRKIPPKKKAKKKSWNLPSIPVLVAAAIAYTYFASNDANANADLGKKLLQEAMQLFQKNKLHDSIKVIDRSIEADPYVPAAYSNKAGILRFLGRHKEALETLLDGDKMATAHYGENHRELYLVKQGLFHLYKDLGDPTSALINIKRAAELAPSADVFVSWAGLDSVVSDEERILLYTKALELDPDHIQAFCLRHHTYGFVGDWEKVNAEHDRVLEYQKRVMGLTRRFDTACLQPYMISYMDFTAEMMRDTAKLYALRETNVGEGEKLPPLLPSQVPDQYGRDGLRARRLRIGYVSSDLNQDHPIGRNVLGLLMAHDKEKVDVYCFSTKHSEGDPVTDFIKKTVTYVDLTKAYMSYTAIAKMIREEYMIDVLIDLNGWTLGRRLEIFAARPAPVQITHGLGFVGTSGVDAFQYFITDAIATPRRFDHLYTEKVVRLPHAYLPASHKTVHLTAEGENYNPAKADKMALRKQEGLPEDQDIFVYCSFQSLNKISDKSFDTWMRILQRSPNSVLWFTSVKAMYQYKLWERAEEKFGIGRERLVFGESKPIPLHLVRAQACDLMLDSWPYNAHSTAVDILWAGVPFLVYLSDYHNPDAAIQVPKMCSRVSASLLHTMGLPHLIKSTIKEFEDEAVRLSKDRNAYEAQRNDLIKNLRVSPLYDLKTYAYYHEMAYIELFERFKRGEKPRELTLSAEQNMPIA